MDIGRLIMDLVAKRSAPPVAPPPDPSVPPPPAPGASAPAAPPPTAEAYKSPPDLVAMYSKMLEKTQNAARIDQGMTLIAAGFAQPQNRPGLLAMANNAGGGGGNAPSLNELLALQKYADERKDIETRRANLPAIMEAHGLDQATVEYLDATGQLDETLAQLAQPETEVVEASDGSKMLIDSRTGETIKPLSDAKPRATEYVEMGDGSKILVYTDTKRRVDNDELVAETTATPLPFEYKELADGTIQPMQNGKPVGDPIGPEDETIEVKPLADGTIQKFVNGVPVDKPVGPKTEKPITIHDLSNGQLIAVRDGVPIGEPFGPEENVTTDDIKEWERSNAEEKAADRPETSLKEWLAERDRAKGVHVTVDKNGVPLPELEKGRGWRMNKDGSVMTNERGEPISYAIEGGGEDLADVKTHGEIDKAEREAAAEEAGVRQGRIRDVVKNNIINHDINNALNILLKNRDSAGLGVTGWGSLLRYLPSDDPYGARALAKAVQTVQTTIGFEELKAMRLASPNGAALGNVTERENEMLQKVMGSLDVGGSDEILAKDLVRIAVGRDLIVNGVYDPEHPYTNPENGMVSDYHPPSDAEIQAAMDEAESFDLNTMGEEVGVEKKLPGATIKKVPKFPEPPTGN